MSLEQFLGIECCKNTDEEESSGKGRYQLCGFHGKTVYSPSVTLTVTSKEYFERRSVLEESYD